MSIATEITRLQTAKADLKTAIEGKGVTVPSATKIDGYADLVDAIQSAYNRIDGIVINPGAYTHTSVAILDAVKSVSVPTVEVHISDPDTREDFRKVSYIRLACVATVKGKGFEGYLEAMDILVTNN